MKKKTLGLVALLAMSLTLGACGPSTGPSTPTESSPTTSERVTRYTVAFEVDGERYRTESVKEGEKITAVIPIAEIILETSDFLSEKNIPIIS